MEGLAFFPEYDPDDEESSTEKKDKKEKKPSFLELVKDPEKLKDDKPEKKDIDESQVPLETLAEDEKQLVAEEYVKARGQEVQQELATVPVETPTEVEVLANVTFLEKLHGKLAAGESPDDDVLDVAVQETADELGIEVTEVDKDSEKPAGIKPIQPETVPTEIIETDVEEAEADVELSTSPEIEKYILPEDIEEEPEDDDTTAVSTSGSTSSPVTPTKPTAVTPTSPSPSAPPPPISPPHISVSPGGGSSTPGAPPGRRSPGPGPRPPEGLEGPPPGSYFLLGGLIGYMIGRRRGRIKTEKRLLPIQHKLEKEAQDLQSKIAKREEKIRATTREQVVTKSATQERIVERLEKRRIEKEKIAKEKPQLDKVEKKEVFVQPTQSSQELFMQPQKPEGLGKFVLGAEKPREQPKPLAAMTLSEVLSIGEHIQMEQLTVKRLYETSRINEQKVREVVHAYLNGEHYQGMKHETLRNPEVLNQQERHEQLPADKVTQKLSGTNVFVQAAEAIQLPTTDTYDRYAHLTAERSRAEAQANATKKRVMQAGLVVTIIVAVVVFTLLLLG